MLRISVLHSLAVVNQSTITKQPVEGHTPGLGVSRCVHMIEYECVAVLCFVVTWCSVVCFFISSSTGLRQLPFNIERNLPCSCKTSQCTVMRKVVVFCSADFSSPRPSRQRLSVEKPHLSRHHDSPRCPLQPTQKLIGEAAACASSTKSKPPSRPSSMFCSICLALVWDCWSSREAEISNKRHGGFVQCARNGSRSSSVREN